MKSKVQSDVAKYEMDKSESTKLVKKEWRVGVQIMVECHSS